MASIYLTEKDKELIKNFMNVLVGYSKAKGVGEDFIENIKIKIVYLLCKGSYNGRYEVLGEFSSDDNIYDALDEYGRDGVFLIERYSFILNDKINLIHDEVIDI